MESTAPGLRAGENSKIPLKQFVRAASRKHRDLLQLEESLFEKRKAGRVIVASQMVANEIIDHYGYPADKIDLVRKWRSARQIPIRSRGFAKDLAQS